MPNFYLLELHIWASSWENRIFAYAEAKTQISFEVTAKLISAFIFAIRMVQSLYYLNPKFQASSHLLWCTARFVWDLVGNPEDRFSHNEAHLWAALWKNHDPQGFWPVQEPRLYSNKICMVRGYQFRIQEDMLPKQRRWSAVRYSHSWSSPLF